MRYVVEVAQQRNFSHAADRLHVAQQALSQQIKSVETQLGVQLFTRTNRGVELTPAGAVFVQEARRVIAAANRAVSRTQAVAKGEAGSIRAAYTLATVYETLPAIVEQMKASHPKLKLDLREVFGGDIPQLLSEGSQDAAICPRTTLPEGFARQEVRREPFVAAVSSEHPLARRDAIALEDLADERFELWPRDMAPGFHDAVLGACRGAGFEPQLDEHTAGSTVWGNIAQNRGVGLVVRSLVDQLPRGIVLVALSTQPVLIIDLVWHQDTAPPALHHLIEAVGEVARRQGWLRPPAD
jgi:DNA-binding transcriptional LysR family regulator